MAKPPKKGPLPKISKPAAKKPAVSEMAIPKPSRISEHTFIYSVLAVFFIIGLIGVLHHDMWRDELQIWLVGVSSHNVSDFIFSMKNETNPLGWYGFDFILSRFSLDPFIVQIFHLLFATGTVYLILKYAPFTRLQKFFVSFSYYLFFEYSIIARGYAMSVFFIFLFCVLYQQVKSKNRYLYLSLVLFFLANTTGHAVIMTLALLGMMITDYLFSEDNSIRKKYSFLQFGMGVVIALLGVYLSIKWITPSAGNHYGNNWYTAIDAQRMERSFRTFWMSFIPIPQLSTMHFWSSNMFYAPDTGPFTFTVLRLLSICLIIYCLLFYSNKLSIAAFYFAGTAGVLLFHYTNSVIFSINAANHYGFIFITFIAAAWLAPFVKKSKFGIPGLKSLRNKLKVEKNFPYLVTALFAINMLAGIIAFGKSLAYNFTNIKLAGNYITSHHLDKLPETGFIDYAVSPISTWTKQPIYFPDRDTIGMHTINIDTRMSFDPNILISRISKYISKQKDSVLFISTGDYFGIGEGKVIGNIQFTRIASFYDCIVPDENYVLYIARNFDLNKLMSDSASFKNPATVNSIVLSVNGLIQSGKLDDAEKVLTTVQEKTHGGAIPHLHNYLGMIEMKRNMQAEAKKEFNTEITLNLQKEEAFFNLGILYFQDKDYQTAIKDWDSTIAINPKNADAYYNTGAAYLNTTGPTKSAETCFEKAVEINPNYTQAYFNILSCAQSLNDQDALVKYIRALLDKGTSADDIRAKGINITEELAKKINAR